MPIYVYKGIDSEGKKKRGVIEADNPRLAKEKLRVEGIFPLEIKTGERTSELFQKIKQVKFLKRITGEDITLFTAQLSTLLNSGMPLYESLSAIVEQTDDLRFKSVVSKLKEAINEGKSLADAMEKCDGVFSPLYINMVRAGESSGSLDIVLMRLFDYMESQSVLRRKVLTAMIYPVIILLVMIIVIWVLMSFVIPRITRIFEDIGQALPLYTRILIGVSNFISKWWPLILLFTGIIFYLFRRFKNSPEGKKRIDLFKLRFPVFGRLYRMVIIARFSKTLGTLLQNGVPIVKALDIVKGIVNNYWIEEVIEKAKESVEEGAPLYLTLKKSEFFPPIVTHMIATGERSGELEKMLFSISKNFESQIDAATSALTSVIEPIMILLMAGVVFFLIISIVLPIFQLNQLVR